MVLSVFYDMSVIAAVGDTTPTGETIDSIDGFASINDNGRVAFTANVSDALGAGSALVVDDGTGAPVVLNIPNADQSFAFPQINNAGLVTARDRFGTTVDSFVRTWNSNSPGQFTTVAGTDAAAGDIYDSVTLPTLADNGAIGFIGFTGGSAQTDLYYNASGTRFDDEPVLGVTGTGGLRPMISNNGMLVVKRGSGASADIVVASTGGTFSIASSATGFTSLGSAPSISDNGRLVAFAGDRGNGPGIFLAVLNASGTALDSLQRVAGETAAPGNHRELGYDAAGNPLFLNAFDIESRIGLSRRALGPAGLEGDSVVLTFIATPNAASRPNPQAGGRPLLFSDQSGLWTVQVDFQNELTDPPFALQPHVKSPIPVVQIGDTIAGQAVTGITLYDPIGFAATDDMGNARTPRMGEHRLAFVASTATTSMVVRATQLDSDEDGLYDHWERAGGGIDMDQDGVIDLDLNAMGASVLSRDLFLEVDWLNRRNNGGASQWSNEPPPGVPPMGAVPGVPSATQYVAFTLGAAPALANGIPAGITVHLDAGPGVDALQNPFSLNMPPALMQGGDQIGQRGTGAHLDVVHFGLPGSVAVPGVQARALSDIKDNFFGTADKRARELAFRYVVLADFKGLLFDAAGNLVSGNVSAATATTITSTAPLPALPAHSPNYFGHVVMITAGTGAGQIRQILAEPVAGQLTVVPWSVIPDATSQFVILHGSSGQGEADWFPHPDNYSVPGNDFVVSMGGFGVNQGILSNSFETGRTIVHELGHTLGLRHGGVDHNAFKGANYLSLMSYSHQTTVGSPVNSYSVAGDPTFDDWANLKLGFQNTLVHVGNSFGLGLGNIGQPEPEPELTVAQVEELNGGPLDFDAPNLSIVSPATDATVQLNDAFTVAIEVNDPSGVGAVQVRFDANGDGDTDDAAERVLAAIGVNGNYTASFDSLSGLAGSRTLRVIAIDVLGNFRIDERNIEVVADDDPNGPEIRVTGGGLSIVDGSVNPTAADQTDFGSVVRDQPKPRRNLTAHNTGAAALMLGALSLPAGFSVVEPLAGTLAVGQSDSFTVELDTATVGAFTGEISFSTNDLNENPFTFVISGIVAAPAPEIEVIGNGQIIVDGYTSPSTLDQTDFGLGGQFQTGPTRVFTVRNVGTADLTLGAVTLPSGFAIVEPLVATLAQGGSDTFSVRLETSANGTFGGEISFSTNDANENPFNFAVSGSVATLPGSLDLTFGGGDGWVTNRTSFGDRAETVVIQPDDKILLGGVGGHISAGFMMARYHPNGDVDTTFGEGDGVVTTDFGGEEGKKLLLLPDGKILFVGYAHNGRDAGIGFARYNVDGTLDTTFGPGGRVIRFLRSILDIQDAALQPDGKIVVVGFNDASGSADFAVARLNGDGTMDTSFGGGDGLAITDFGAGTSDFTRAVAIQPDGKIVVTGQANGQDYGTARYNADGSLDVTFGGGDGLVVTNGAVVANDVRVLPDGRIVVAGRALQEVGTFGMVGIAQYNADGSPDTTFGGGDGIASTNFPDGQGEEANVVLVQPDGKLVVVGFITRDGGIVDSNLLLVRYNADGTLDTGFGDGGRHIAPVGGPNVGGNAAALQSDGKIVIAGHGSYESNPRFAVSRYHGDAPALPTVTVLATDAEGDESGANDLRFSLNRSGPTDQPLTVVFRLQNDGAAGQATLGSDFQVAPGATQITIPAGAATAEITVTPVLDAEHESDELVIVEIMASPGYTIGLPYIADGTIRGECDEIELNGELDPTFGEGDGFAVSDFELRSQGTALALAPDGKIVVVGSTLSLVPLTDGGFVRAPGAFVSIARFRANGLPDPSFGNDGFVVTPVEGPIGPVTPGVAVQPDGKIIAAGAWGFPGGITNFGMARYLPNGAIDTSFGGGDGLVETDFAGGSFPHDFLNAIAIQPDGKILLAGGASTDTGRAMAIARYNADGSLDATFGGGDGLVLTNTDAQTLIRSLALTPDGKIIAVSSDPGSGFLANTPFVLARYNADGVLDPTFGGGTGLVTVRIGDHARANEVVIEPGGKILVVGSTIIAPPIASNEFFAVLARYNADGTPDTSFGGGDGFVLEKFIDKPLGDDDAAKSVLVQPDGRILVVGADDGKVVIARYNPDGTRDVNFGGDGMIHTGAFAHVDGLLDAVLQADGKLVFTNRFGIEGVTGLNLTRLTGQCIIAEGNQSPVLDPIADRTSEVGQAVSFTATATDPDGDNLTFSLDTGAPAGAAINAQTGEFTFTPTAVQDGQVLSITVRVTDDGQPALGDIETFTITVAAQGNLPPVLDPIADRIGEVDQTVIFTATAIDPAGDNLTFSLDAGAPTGATINAQTGQFSFTPSAAQAGQVFSITVRVTDDGSPALADTETFDVTVQPQVEPQFTLSPINGPDVGVPGQLRSYSVTFTDPNSVGGYTTTIDWGDGVVDSGFMSTQTSGGVTTGVVSLWHTYTTIGDRNIRLTLSDRLGNQLTAQKFITVQLVTFQPDPLNASRRALVAGGLEGVDDLITFNPQSGGINVMYRDYNHGRFVFDGSAIAFGQSGNDTIRVHPSITNTSMLFGQAGDDLLGAGAGASVLVGGAGNDTLHGSALRDLLFGGLGADLLHGIASDRTSAMDEGDLIASDVTAWEYDPNLLASIFDRWNSTSSYADRLTNLRYQQSPALNNTTVFDDFAADRLTGGTGLDWFVFFSTDLVADAEIGEEGLGVRL